MYFWSPDIFAFMVDPPQTTPKAKNGGLIWDLYYIKIATHPWFSLKTSKTDLENGKNPPFLALGVVWGGSTIKAKMSGDQKYMI